MCLFEALHLLGFVFVLVPELGVLLGARLGLHAAAFKLLPASAAARVCPAPVAFSVMDGEAYDVTWRRLRRATRANALAAAGVALLVGRRLLVGA